MSQKSQKNKIWYAETMKKITTLLLAGFSLMLLTLWSQVGLAQRDPCAGLTSPDRITECRAEHGQTVTPGESGRVDVQAGGGKGEDKLNDLINAGINILSALAGLAIVGSIIVGGIQYMTAQGNSQQVASAKNRIMVSVVTFIVFLFGYALLQWLIPGGLW